MKNKEVPAPGATPSFARLRLQDRFDGASTVKDPQRPAPTRACPGCTGAVKSVRMNVRAEQFAPEPDLEPVSLLVERSRTCPEPHVCAKVPGRWR